VGWFWRFLSNKAIFWWFFAHHSGVILIFVFRGYATEKKFQFFWKTKIWISFGRKNHIGTALFILSKTKNFRNFCDSLSVTRRNNGVFPSPGYDTLNFFPFFWNFENLEIFWNFLSKKFERISRFWKKNWFEANFIPDQNAPVEETFFLGHHSEVILTQNFDFSKYICWCNHVTKESELLLRMFLHDYLTIWPFFHSPIKILPWRSKWAKYQMSKWT